MKSLFAALGLLAAVLCLQLSTEAGDKLQGSKSYSMVMRDGSHAGHVTTDSSGDSITYYPGNGDPAITYDWDATTGRYRNSVRGDYFEFFSWPSKTWIHGYDDSSAGTGTAGTYTENPDVITPDSM